VSTASAESPSGRKTVEGGCEVDCECEVAIVRSLDWIWMEQ
jgi:hypothetical protein